MVRKISCFVLMWIGNVLAAQDKPSDVGDLTPRILNGEIAKEGQFPWMVALYRKGEFLCSASILSDRLVLTAAHCINENETKHANDFVGHAGNVNRSTPALTIQFQSIHPHPDFDIHDSRIPDIAVMVTREPIRFDARVRPLCLASQGVRLRPLTKVEAMGWGETGLNSKASPVLLHVSLWLMKGSYCRIRNEQKEHFRICAGSHKKGLCFGDSGGPLVLRRRRGVPLQVGVASYVIKDESGCGKRVVFARVGRYRKFVFGFQKKHDTKVCFVDY